MLNMSFYNGTLNRSEAAGVVRASNKPLYHRYGFAYRGAEKRHISKESALKIIENTGNYLDIKEDETEIVLNTFSEMDMW